MFNNKILRFKKIYRARNIYTKQKFKQTISRRLNRYYILNDGFLTICRKYIHAQNFHQVMSIASPNEKKRQLFFTASE